MTITASTKAIYEYDSHRGFSDYLIDGRMLKLYFSLWHAVLFVPVSRSHIKSTEMETHIRDYSCSQWFYCHLNSIHCSFCTLNIFDSHSHSHSTSSVDFFRIFSEISKYSDKYSSHRFRAGYPVICKCSTTPQAIGLQRVYLHSTY